MTAILARMRRGFARMWAWTKGAGLRLIGRREHRFESEGVNLADQLAQTRTSIGLMAVAAQHSDDEHRRQALQTEQTLRERKRVLEANRRRRGLADEERWELESISRGLDELHATPETVGHLSMRMFGAVGTANPLMGILASPMTWVALAFTIPAAWGSVQTARLNHAKGDLREARQAAADNLAAAQQWRERSEEYRQGLIDAANVARNAAAALEAERAADARRAARERRRNREIANVLTNSPEPPEWRLREPAPTEDQPTSP